MSNLSTNGLYAALVERLETLTGQSVGELTGASSYRLLFYLLELFNAFEGGTGAPAITGDVPTFIQATQPTVAKYVWYQKQPDASYKLFVEDGS